MRIRLLLAALALMLASTPAQAVLCGTFLAPVRVTATNMSFAPYFATATSDLQANATVTIDCGVLNLDLLPSFTVSLSPGNATSPSPRFMLRNGAHLNYNIYTTNGYGTVWGDATGGSTQSFSSSGLNTSNVQFTAWGLLFKGQFVAAGTYNDTVMVTVDY